jgi:hypothetical protein
MLFQLLQFWMILLARLRCLKRSCSFLWKWTQWKRSMTSPFLSTAFQSSSNSQQPQIYSQLSPLQSSSSISSSFSQLWEWSWLWYSCLNLARSSFSWLISVSPVNFEPDKIALSYALNQWSSPPVRAELPNSIGSKLSSGCFTLIKGFSQKYVNIDINLLVEGAGLESVFKDYLRKRNTICVSVK